MDDNNDIVWNGEPIAHKDVDELQENENIANLENFPFTEIEGLKVRMNDQSIIDFVKLYLTDEVLSNRNKSFCRAISCSCSGEN